MKMIKWIMIKLGLLFLIGTISVATVIPSALAMGSSSSDKGRMFFVDKNSPHRALQHLNAHDGPISHVTAS